MKLQNSILGALTASAVMLLALPASGQEDVPDITADGKVTRLGTIFVQGGDAELKKQLSPGEVSIVYPDDTKGEHKSLPDLLDQIPGVYVRRVTGTGQYTTASIRGSAPSQVNIYIDGIPYNTASESATDLSTIPMSNVERVEVYRGTTPARFSGAPLGGAINIVTKRPDEVKSSVSAGARSYGGRQLSASTTMPLLGGTLMLGADGTSQERRQIVDEHNAALGWRESFGDLTLGLTGTFMDSDKRYKNLSMERLPPHQQSGVGSVWMDYRTRRYGIAGDATYELDMDNFSHRFEVHAEHLWETLSVDANNRVSSAGYESDLFTNIWRNRAVLQAQDTITIHQLGGLELTPILRFEKMTGPQLGSRLSALLPATMTGNRPTDSAQRKICREASKSSPTSAPTTAGPASTRSMATASSSHPEPTAAGSSTR